ncbi:MAG: phage tail sheath protein [Acidobacteriota bacterium]
MSRIVFQPDLPVTPDEPDRADVACFVGLVRLRRGADESVTPLPITKLDWLRLYGWLDGPHRRDCDLRYDIPVPIENYAAFYALYDDGRSADAVGTDYLALAVQAFFAQGGQRCYVVRMGDPIGPKYEADVLHVGANAADRAATIPRLLAPDASPEDQSSWHGVAHLWGLPDVSFLLLPDLPLLHAAQMHVAKGETEDLALGPEQFIPCVPSPAPSEDLRTYPLPAPRFGPAEYQAWSATLRTVVQRLSTSDLREVQFVAAMPLPFEQPISPAFDGPSAGAATGVQDAIALVLPELTADAGLSASSAFLQLAYPWLRTTRSHGLLEGLEPPDGTLAGLLARNALLRGTFTSATKIAPADIVDLFPALPMYETLVPASKPVWQGNTVKPLVVRLSLFGFTPAGIRLLSDVTTYPGESYRPAPVNRLVSVISRMAQHLGESHLFESHGPRLWAQLERTLRAFLTRLWGLGALDGASPAEAFDVHCDRNTMTQNDIDNGRIVAVVGFQAAASIELITVTLTVQAGSTSEAEIQAQLTGAA